MKNIAKVEIESSQLLKNDTKLSIADIMEDVLNKSI